ncbi:MAG: quinohemoprotein ethanol dehydrogenase, partial [Actinomycetota bacterium]
METTGSWELPAHDLAATRRGGQIAGTRVEWRAELKGGVAGAPAIVGGSVFAASIGGVIASVDLATGHVHWQRQFATPVYGSGAGRRRLGFFGGVAVDRDRVLAASDRVVALDRRTGRTIWTAEPLRTSTSDDYFWGPPVIARGLVLVGSGSGAELPTARGRLSAYSLSDGSLVWSTPTVPAGANGGGIIAPASVALRTNLAHVATGSPYRAVPGRNPGTGSLLA